MVYEWFKYGIEGITVLSLIGLAIVVGSDLSGSPITMPDAVYALWVNIIP